MKESLEFSEDMINRLEEKEKHIYEQEQKTEEVIKESAVAKNTFLEDIPKHHKSYIKINKEIFPSECMFYPEDWNFYIRPARITEIREFSSLHEDSSYRTNEAINIILSSCMKITSSTSQINPKNCLEIDKIFLLLAVRDLTFYEIENELVNISSCPSCGKNCNIKIYSNNTLFFDHDLKIKGFYDIDSRSYVFNIESTGEKLSLRPPTMAITEKINTFNKHAIEKGLNVDPDSLNKIRYLDLNWNNISYEELQRNLIEISNWSMIKISMFEHFVKDFENQFSSKSIGICESCSAEVAVPFSFQGPYRSIFLVQDPYRYAR